jgi:hypothetical protein
LDMVAVWVERNKGARPNPKPIAAARGDHPQKTEPRLRRN